MLAALLCTTLTASPALAANQAGGSPGARYAPLTVYSNLNQVAPGRKFWVAFEVDLDEGWHAYWMNPGDMGAPTRVDWTLPTGWTASPLRFPTPESFRVDEFVAFGHSGRVTFLTELTAPQSATGKTRFEGRLRLQVCNAMCVPADQPFRFELAVGKTMEYNRNQDRLLAALRQLPTFAGTLGRYRIEGRTLHVVVPQFRRRGGEVSQVFVGQSGTIDHKAPLIRQSWVDQDLHLELRLAEGDPAPLTGLLPIVVRTADGKAFEFSAAPQPAPPATGR